MAQNNETRIPRAKILKLYESSLNEVFSSLTFILGVMS